MMNKDNLLRFLYLGNYLCLMAFVAVFTACSADEGTLPEPGSGSDAPLSVRVSVNDFADTDARSTRAADDGLKTVFDGGDCFGLIILDKNGNVLCNNVPYKKSWGSWSWSFDAGNIEGKTAPFYDSQFHTYIAYFPYSKEADGVKSLEALKQKFPPLDDQRSKSAYRSSDLLVWQSTPSTAQKEITITFTHAYALFYFTPKAVLDTDAGNVALSVNSDEVNFTINGKTYYPYKEAVGQYNSAPSGNYRLLLPASASSGKAGTSLRWFFPFGESSGGGTASDLSFTANQLCRHTAGFTFGSYKIADNNVAVGDFYCSKSNDDNTRTAYLLPGYAPMVTAEDKALVVGIVYKMGNPTDTNAETNGDAQLATDHSNCTHGWVVAKKFINSTGAADEYGYMKWSDPSEDINSWAKADSHYSGYTDGDIRSESKRNGYSNTKVLDAYNQQLSSDKQNYQVVTANAVNLFRTNNAASSSNWYLPSKQELQDLWSAKDAVGSQLSKISGDGFGRGDYWSSTEYDASFAWYVYFRYGGAYSYAKSYDNLRVRPVLAF